MGEKVSTPREWNSEFTKSIFQIPILDKLIDKTDPPNAARQHTDDHTTTFLAHQPTMSAQGIRPFTP
jgi:hypothetical protein